MNKFDSPVTFKLDDVFSWGIQKDRKFKNYTLPIKPNEETLSEVNELVKIFEAKNPIYNGETLYLKIKPASLTDKQKEELIDCGRCRVKVAFNITGVFTSKDDINYLVFETIGLKKLDEEETPKLLDDF